MKQRWFARTIAAAAVLLAASSGCALISRKGPVQIRYFTPEGVQPRLTSGETTSAPRAPLTLGRVTSGSDLRERIAYRESAHEVGYYEDRRWTEPPETYVRRELSRVLFEERGFARVLGGEAPELHVEVLAFEELKLAQGRRAARVRLNVMLVDDERVLFEETFTVDRPVSSDEPTFEEVVRAMGVALVDVGHVVAARVANAIAPPATRR